MKSNKRIFLMLAMVMAAAAPITALAEGEVQTTEAPAITSITANASEMNYVEGLDYYSIQVSIAGNAGFKADTKYELGIYMGDTPYPSTIIALEGPQTTTLAIPANRSSADLQCTIRASMDKWATRTDVFARITLKANTSTRTPLLTGISANPTQFKDVGGVCKISVSGEYYESANTEIAVFEGDRQSDDIPSVVITGNGYAEIKFPANNTNSDKAYTVRARTFGGEWRKSIIVTVQCKPASQNGWGKDANGVDVFYRNNEIVRNDWIGDGSTWYHMDENGHKHTGWFTDKDGRKYFLETDGLMQKGLLQHNNSIYMLSYGSGQLMYGWCMAAGTWYYTDPHTGIVQTGWQKVNGDWYLLGSDGKMKTGWNLANGRWYYMDDTGRMAKGWLRDVDGRWYYLNSSGAMVTGTQTINGRRSRFSSSGVWLGYN